MFDNRPTGALARIQAEQANLLSLAHEAMHQLTFNTGLLDRDADVPLAVSEGLATYGEVRKAVGTSPLGQKNQGRLDGLRVALAGPKRIDWIPIKRLLTEDSLFGGQGDEVQPQLAYGESWLFVHEMMRPPKPEAFRAYLEVVRMRDDSRKRLDDARLHFGDLDRLDRRLREAALKLM
jgi:hypothetical protein